MVTVAISRHGGGVWQLVHAAERVHGRPQDGAIGAQNGGQRGTKSRNTSMCGYVWQVPGDPCPLVCYFKECIEPRLVMAKAVVVPDIFGTCTFDVNE